MIIILCPFVDSVFQHAKAGMVAGLFTTLFMAPGERIKCLLQVIGNASAADTINFRTVNSVLSGSEVFSFQGYNFLCSWNPRQIPGLKCVGSLCCAVQQTPVVDTSLRVYDSMIDSNAPKEW